MLISTPVDITAEWLTERLAQQGVLQRGVVTQIEIGEQSSRRGTFGNTTSLAVTYSLDTTGLVPRQLFLKISKAHLHPEVLALGAREVGFYDAMQGYAEGLPIPRCYDSVYDAESGHSHILIDDLSSTHVQPAYPLPPAPEQCAGIMWSLAQLHAHWWNSTRIVRDLSHLCDINTATATRLRLEATLPSFLHTLGDALLPAQQHVYHAILSSSLLARREARLQSLAQVTLNHGDAHAWSFMLPRSVEGGPVLVIDWQLWEMALPTDDLAYFMALWWTAGRRAALEWTLVETYHRHLLARGVGNYDWDACWRDYRESVAYITLVPIGQFRRKAPLSVLWNGLENSMAAFHDLQCADLL